MKVTPTTAHGYNRADDLPQGVGVVLAEQRTGFWGRPSDGLANPEFTASDVPNRIYTFEPWLGCLWGKSCTFCYVPNLSSGHYPGGSESRWFKDWGRWIAPKPSITERLREQLFDAHGRTRSKYRGAFVFMSAKTDPFLPRSDLLKITRDNLAVFAEAEVFLMCQTRSAAVVEDGEIFAMLRDMAGRGKVGVSFSIATDRRAEQRRIERGGLSPERRLATMEKLRSAGIFVSAAVSPVMPFSSEFSRLLVERANYASVQALRPSGFGSATPKRVLDEVQRAVPDYRRLEFQLVRGLERHGPSGRFSWGVGSKGFMGAFLAARRFYGAPVVSAGPCQLRLLGRPRM